jgi:hypothetical protein
MKRAVHGAFCPELCPADGVPVVEGQPVTFHRPVELK